MKKEIIMPRMGQSMEEGTLLRWLKRAGDVVEKGEHLAEIETDKSTVEVEALAAGRLLELRIDEGTTVPIGTVIAIVDDGEPGEASEPSAPQAAAGGRVDASPIARRLAQEHGIDLHDVSGTGPEGRIVKEDVLAVLGREEERPGFRTERLGALRARVARRMEESRSTVPDFSVSADVEATALLSLKETLAAQGARVTLNDIFVRAAAIALGDFPRLNATFADNVITMRDDVDCAIAVATEQGLLAPVIRSCRELTLPTLAERSRDLIAGARAGTLRPDELEGGSFTVTNLGMHGVRSFEPIINVPQTAILAVGGLRSEARFDDSGKVHPVPVLTLTCVADHRATDGEEVARFLVRLRAICEGAGELR